MDTKHTPGPYRLQRCTQNCIEILDDLDRTVCQIYTDDDELSGLDVANAQHIRDTLNSHEALLAAAKRVIRNWQTGDLALAVRQLDAAIAQAEPVRGE